MSKHWKRSPGFYAQMLQLAQKLLGVHDKKDLREAARLITECTTDSGCMVRAGSAEPVFVLRAKDPVAKLALATWINEAKRMKLHGDKMQDAQECLKEFVEFR